jgi:hypothetical protein
MSDRNYGRNAAKVLEHIKGQVEAPLVLFQERCSSWGPSPLTAAVQHPEDPQRFLVIGVFQQFPGWDPAAVSVPDWDVLLGVVEGWVSEMNREAVTTQMPVENVGRSRPIFGQETGPRWVRWIPENGAFSRASGMDMMRNTTPLAPQDVVEQVRQWEERHSLEKELHKAQEAVVEAEAAVQKGKETLATALERVREIELQL